MVSPVDSYNYLMDLLSEQGSVYEALEQVYQDSVLVSHTLGRSRVVGGCHQGRAMSELDSNG